MILTKELAACSIYGFEITTENKEKSMSLLQKAGLVPVYLVNGDPTLAVAIGINKIKTEPWKYQEFKSEENRKNKEKEYKKSEDSYDSYEIKVPQSKRAVVELIKIITSPSPIENITYEEFLTEKEFYELGKKACDVTTLGGF
ncbi:hypothetical protein G6F56_000416 [Rhizopus delemar]|nr:hypothetical protein G6F56_000416 [Rhizopus delemar]